MHGFSPVASLLSHGESAYLEVAGAAMNSQAVGGAKNFFSHDGLLAFLSLVVFNGCRGWSR